MKRGTRVLDLGCSPGSWLLFASKIVGEQGLVLGVDLTPLRIRLPRNARFIEQNVLVRDDSFIEAVGTGFDVVLSDMAPSTTGNKFVDSQRSLELSEAALEVSDRVLKRGGGFICKVFQGGDFKRFSDTVKERFKRVVHVKPKATRRASKEVYVVAIGKKDAQARNLEKT